MKIDPNILRRRVLKMVYEKKSGHIGGSFSLAELVAHLYSNYDLTGKDKLILSKGHAVPIIYAALREIGVLTDQDLDTFREINSRLQGHPDKRLLPEVTATTGALGQGLSIAIGHALAKKMRKEEGKIFCILGDGEIQEGQVWEGIMLAPTLGLNNLVAIIDVNGAQNDGKLHPMFNEDPDIYEKISQFNWECHQVDGHNQAQIEYALTNSNGIRPQCLVAETIKGQGVSFMEGAEWHAKVPNEEEYQKAMEELK